MKIEHAGIQVAKPAEMETPEDMLSMVVVDPLIMRLDFKVWVLGP